MERKQEPGQQGPSRSASAICLLALSHAQPPFLGAPVLWGKLSRIPFTSNVSVGMLYTALGMAGTPESGIHSVARKQCGDASKSSPGSSLLRHL